MSVLCRFEVRGNPDAPETGTMADVDVPLPVTVAALRRAFPFEGTFHFRQRVLLDAGKGVYAWLDLSEGREEVRAPAAAPSSAAGRPILEIRVRFFLFFNFCDGEIRFFSCGVGVTSMCYPLGSAAVFR